MAVLDLNISTYNIKFYVSRDKEKIRKRLEHELYMNEILEKRRELSCKYPRYFDNM